MIAASLKAAEGDKIIDLLLRKGADVSVKSSSGQVSFSLSIYRSITKSEADPRRTHCISQVPKPTSPQYEPYLPTSAALE